MLDLYAPLPWEAVAAAQTTGDFVPVPARELAPPADAYRRAVRPLAYVPPPAIVDSPRPWMPDTVPAHALAHGRRVVAGQMFASGSALIHALIRRHAQVLGDRLTAVKTQRAAAVGRALWRAGRPSPTGGRAF